MPKFHQNTSDPNQIDEKISLKFSHLNHPIDKKIIVESLLKIMCTATVATSTSDKDGIPNDYFKRRILGFKAEIEFEKEITKKELSFLEGGQFISKKLSGNKDDKNNFIYTSVDCIDEELYLPIYRTISKWAEVSQMFYIKYSTEDWNVANTSKFEPFTVKLENDDNKKLATIFTPAYEIYGFNKLTSNFEKLGSDFKIILDLFDEPQRAPSISAVRKHEQFEYFFNYDIHVLKKIYSTRYFIDHILRKAGGKQLIDLDGFIVKKDKAILIEIKEKTPMIPDPKHGQVAAESKWQYGWDTRRLLWYLYLLNNADLHVIYCIRQVDEKVSRKFVQWDCLKMSDFLKGTSWSFSQQGGGMGDTVLAPYSFFKRIDEILEEI
jgi:hypothetical protein